jgi:hypothetical protein
MPYSHEVAYRVVNDFGNGPLYSDEQFISTGEIPSGMSVPDDVSGDPDQWNTHTPYILTSINQPGYYLDGLWWVMILDRAGRPVWARQTEMFYNSMHPRLSHDETSLFIDYNAHYGQFNYDLSYIVKMKIDGTVLETYDTPGMHHDYTDTADGSLLWGAFDGSDEKLRRINPDGTIDEIWSCLNALSQIGTSGSCGSNTLYWHEQSDTLLFSFYSLSSVFEIDHATGETLRQFGNIKDTYDFDPSPSLFYWQHGTNFTDAGTLLTSTYLNSAGVETIAREYAIGEETETLVEIWNYGIGDGIFGDVMGEAHRLENGNTLHNTGSNARLREATPMGDTVWDANWLTDTIVGRSTPIHDLYMLAPDYEGEPPPPEQLWSENLLLNPGAEAFIKPWYPEHWVQVAGLTQSLDHDDCFSPENYDGRYFVVGAICGPGEGYGEAMQTVDISSWAKSIDKGKLLIHYGAVMRNWSGYDEPSLRLDYFDVDGDLLGSSTTIVDMSDYWSLRYNEGLVPVGTRSLNFVMMGKRYTSGDNDCYFDNLELFVGIDGDTTAK